MDEYKKCGEITVSATNKLALMCNFCHQRFYQLQAFMRHLQLQHDDKIMFVRQSKEVEIYAVEELINQTVASCATDMESEDYNITDDEEEWLSKEDLKWLDEGEEPKKSQQSNDKECKGACDEEIFNVTNNSILQALEDCDISFSLVDKLNSTKYSEDEKRKVLDSSLLREIQNDWDDNDTLDSIPELNESSVPDRLNCKETLKENNEPPEEDFNVPKFSEEIISIEDTTTRNVDNSAPKSIKSLLQGIEDLEDVDSLLDNLESNTTSTRDTNSNKNKFNATHNSDCAVLNNSCKGKLISNETSNFHKLIEKNKLNILPTFDQEELKITSMGKEILQPIEVRNESVGMSDFELRLQEIENALNEDTLESNYIAKQSILPKKAISTSMLNVNTKTEFELELKQLEISLIGDNNNSTNLVVNENKNSYPQLEKQIKNFEILETKEQDESNISNDAPLNEDLTKALADVLEDEDLNLFNLHLDEESEEPLNEDILNLLEREFNENEPGQELDLEKHNQQVLDDESTSLINVVKESTKNKYLQEKPENRNLETEDKKLETEYIPDRELIAKEVNQKLASQKELRQLFDASTSPNRFGKKNILNKSIKEEINSINMNQSHVVTKYQKTNLKSRYKIIETQHKKETQNKSISKCNNSQILKESNSFTLEQKVKDSQKLLKRNGEILLHKQQLTYTKNVTKSPPNNNMTQRIINTTLQRKTTNKENRENSPAILSIEKIKQEQFTPNTSFVSVGERRNKTPIKSKSPKTQEIQNVTENLTPSIVGKTPRKQNMKESPMSEEKPKILNNLKTPTELKITPAVKNEKFNHSPKTQEKLTELFQNDKTPETPRKYNLSVCNDKAVNTPPKHITQSNGKLSTPLKTVTNSFSLYNRAKTPSTASHSLKQIAIKLQRLTPDKVNIKAKNLEKISAKNDAQQLVKQFKFSKEISMSAVTKISPKLDMEQSKILETPIKATYCKQNFLESSLENLEKEDIKQQSNTTVNPSLTQAQNKVIENIETDLNSQKIRQRMPSIDIVPCNLESTKQQMHNSTKKTPRRSNLDYKSYAVIRSSRKKEVLQRMRKIKKQIFKSIEESECVNELKKMPAVANQKKEDSICIQNVEILPKLTKETLLMFDNFKKPFANNHKTPTTIVDSSRDLAGNQNQSKTSLDCNTKDSTKNNNEKLTKSSLKRKASSPLSYENKFIKRQQTSPVQTLNGEKTSALEKTHLDLSESVMDYLQRDLKTNRLNVESFLKSDMPEDDSEIDETSSESEVKHTKIEGTVKDESLFIIKDLFEQVKNENTKEVCAEKAIEDNKTEKSSCPNFVEDFDDSKDIDLLSKFGLKIIKIPDIEDIILLEERDEMNEKANKFAKIYKERPRIWATKGCENPAYKLELNKNFEAILAEVNTEFNTNLSIVEIKRVTNLITFWFTQNCSGKLIEKRKISESTNRYLSSFSFMPKTTRRHYFCEYCEEHFNTEHKYFTHRIIHTGALYPYVCQRCSTGFKILKLLKNHYALCPPTQNVKCPVCEKIYETSERLYEHSKTHLKNMYRCAKCELVFASAIDLRNHMNICHTTAKLRRPQVGTPRPSKVKQNHFGRAS